jgi:uncharacterized integral membrane protein
MAEISGSDGVIPLLYVGSLIFVIWAVADIVNQPAWRMSRGRKLTWLWPCVLGWLLLGVVGGVVSVIYLTTVKTRLPVQ